MKIYSEPGEGTTVKIYLPRLMGRAEEADEAVRSEDGEMILVVEDDADLRPYLAEVLRSLGYQVITCSDPKAAKVYLAQADRRIDLMLTDIVMPGESGKKLADHALELRPGLKVIFMTGYSRNAVVHQGRLDPGVELLQKPVSQADLASRIREVLDRS